MKKSLLLFLAICGLAATAAPQAVLTVVASFANTNGSGPMAGLTLGPDGNFYGTTAGGGSAGDGTVFRVTPTGWSPPQSQLLSTVMFRTHQCACQ